MTDRDTLERELGVLLFGCSDQDFMLYDDAALVRDAAEVALRHIAAARAGALEEAASICDEWIAMFSGQVINHTRAEEYAEASVRDIADSIRALVPGGDAPRPWSIPASDPPA